MSRPVIPIASLSRRLPKLGRIKDGVKVAGKGQPQGHRHVALHQPGPQGARQVAEALRGES